MSFIVEQAGGKGSDERQRVLDITPTEVSLIRFIQFKHFLFLLS
jgi:hypothetical protein